MKLQGLTPLDLDIPLKEWRPNQLQLAEQIVSSDKKVIILQAPTGSGKSIIVRIPGKVLDQRTLILTRTITLQDQYAEEGLPVLYGRDHYICNRSVSMIGSPVTAAYGICRAGISCTWLHGNCDYYNQKFQAVAAQTAVLNYSYFFREANGPGTFTNYNWIACDEGHTAPQELTSAFTITLSTTDLRKLSLYPPMLRDTHDWVNWAKAYEKKIKGKAKNIAKDKAAILFSLISNVDLLLSLNPEEWVCTSDVWTTVIKPIWPSTLAEKYLWGHASKFIFASATIDPVYTMELLGMSLANVDIITSSTGFPVDRRPIFIVGRHNINQNTTDADLKRLTEDIDRIISKYPDQRGLIHTSNYALAGKILQFSRQGARLMSHTKDDRAAVLEEFKSHKGRGRVLVSPSMAEGVDLNYELCRFNIVAKMPYPNLADPIWKARFNQDSRRAQSAYNGETISTVIQACGRGMRAADDACDNYILDSNFNRVFNSSSNRFPTYFVEAMKYLNTLS